MGPEYLNNAGANKTLSENVIKEACGLTDSKQANLEEIITIF